MGFRNFLKNKAKSALGRGSDQRGQGVAAPGERKDALSSLPSTPTKDGYRALATSGLVVEGRGNTFSLDGRNIALFRVNGTVYAIDDACRHEDGPLGEGDLEGSVVTCPYHNWRFDVTNGDCLTEPERPVPCFGTREQDGVVWVGPPSREGSNARGGEHNDGLETVLMEKVGKH